MNGTVVEYPRYEYDYDVEIPLIETKYRNMLISINQYQNPRAKVNRKRLHSQILHIVNRVNVAPIDEATAEQLELRRKWMAEFGPSSSK